MLKRLWKIPHCWWFCKLVQPPWKTCKASSKTKNKVTIWFSNPTPGHTHRQKYNVKTYMHPYINRSSPMFNSLGHGSNLNFHQQMNGERKYVCVCVCVYTYTHCNITQPLKRMEKKSHGKNEKMLFVATWMNLKITIVNEVNQKHRDKNTLWLICRI